MKRYLLGLALFCSCAHPAAPPALPTVYPRVALSVHVDVDFTQGERWAIKRAVEALAQQTAGWLEVYTTYDLNFANHARIEALSGDAWLVRVDSTYPQVQLEDIHLGGEVLGLTAREEGRRPVMFLVTDRLTNTREFQHVTMHELLHGVGLDHILSPGSVMSGADNPEVTCLSPADTAEACRVWHCQPAQLNGCPWP